MVLKISDFCSNIRRHIAILLAAQLEQLLLDFPMYVRVPCRSLEWLFQFSIVVLFSDGCSKFDLLFKFQFVV